MPVFENLVRSDPSSSGGGIIFYTREGITFELLRINCLSANTETLLVEVEVTEKKRLLVELQSSQSVN